MTKQTIWKRLLVSVGLAGALFLLGCNVSFGSHPLNEDEDMPTLIGRVHINGIAEPGKVLTADARELQGEGTVKLEWLRTSIEKTVILWVGVEYTVVSGDVDTVIRVRASRTGYSGFIYSEASMPIPAATNREYNVGETGPAGGSIIYRDLSGFSLTIANAPIRPSHYLELSKDSFANMKWESTSTGFTTISGTKQGTWENSVLKSAEGKRNTTFIRTILGKNSPAAHTAATYPGTGANGEIFSDWFLPSIIELQLIYEGNHLSDGVYWSSTQDDTDHAWALEIAGGISTRRSMLKSEANSVVPLRAF